MNPNKLLSSNIRKEPLLDRWLQRSFELVASGANAGTSYPEVWIRDLNTFLALGLQVGDPERFRDPLLNFLRFQQEDGGIVDGYTPHDPNPAIQYVFFRTPLCPGLDAHKNDVESDQETSLIQAVRLYVEHTGDLDFLNVIIDGSPVRDRLKRALGFLRRERWADTYGLIWNATTIDWGDTQPEDYPGVRMNADTHRACCIYSNAMAVIALRDMRWMDTQLGLDFSPWKEQEEELRHNIATRLWDQENRKYHPHLYLDGSPFPSDFDEEAIYYHGGTGVAIQADLLDRNEIEHAYQRMQQNRKEAGAVSIGLTVWPMYDIPTSPSRVFNEPGHYQNGGDWPWFGGRIVLGLIRHGFMAEAYEALLPMLQLAEDVGDFNEWHDLKGNPEGAFNFRGSAGVLGLAIQQLQTWAPKETSS